MQVTLTKVGACAFEVTDGRDHRVIIDGPSSLGGTDAGMRPMEMFLSALASCSAVDVLLILGKGRQRVDSMQVQVDGTRADATPAVFTKIEITFIVSGDVAQNKLDRAIQLSLEKYCSVTTMLNADVELVGVGRIE